MILMRIVEEREKDLDGKSRKIARNNRDGKFRKAGQYDFSGKARGKKIFGKEPGKTEGNV